ncbi:MAG: 5-formyltetrahydrofolate cyclo-ligase [Myxococcota bacterium]|nr:5-formyltetrahydrofolate cyclo-ligase [Myxococcota bacterium]
METKTQLRKGMKTRREGLGADERARRSALVAARVLNHPLITQAPCVGLYAAIGSEVLTAPLFEELVCRGQVALPRVNSERDTLEFVELERWDSLVPGAFKVPEPEGPAIQLNDMDLLLVPGLAFDRSGGRLGYGGGFYDKTLERFEGLVFGLAFDLQVVDALPLQGHDQSIDGLFTETATLDFRDHGASSA